MVLGDIGDAAGDEPLDEGPHPVDMLGGARLDGRRQRAKRRDVVVELALGRLRHPPDRLVEGQVREVALGAGVDLVVDVGDVAGVDDVLRPIDMPEQAEEHVEHDDRPRVADMGEVVDRRAADIEAHCGRVDRREVLLAAGQGVVEAQGHRRLFRRGRGVVLVEERPSVIERLVSGRRRGAPSGTGRMIASRRFLKNRDANQPASS